MEHALPPPPGDDSGDMSVSLRRVNNGDDDDGERRTSSVWWGGGWVMGGSDPDSRESRHTKKQLVDSTDSTDFQMYFFCNVAICILIST